MRGFSRSAEVTAVEPSGSILVMLPMTAAKLLVVEYLITPIIFYYKNIICLMSSCLLHTISGNLFECYIKDIDVH